MKNRLKELRKVRGWSQAELARALKISRQAVNGFESGKFTPSLEMAFKIARLFDVAIESVFSYREKSSMQELLARVENFTQWLPKGERFTFKALEAITSARQMATLSEHERVQPEHILLGLLNHPTTAAARLLRESGLSWDSDRSDRDRATPIAKFSPESKYVLELALNAARLQHSKDINTEHLLLGLIQLLQLGNNELLEILQTNNVDIKALSAGVRELYSY